MNDSTVGGFEANNIVDPSIESAKRTCRRLSRIRNGLIIAIVILLIASIILDVVLLFL